MGLCVCLYVGVCVGDTELRSVHESEELLVNVAATINNLSFYQEESAILRHSQLIIAKCKSKRLMEMNVEIKNKKDEWLHYFPAFLTFTLSMLTCSFSFSDVEVDAQLQYGRHA